MRTERLNQTAAPEPPLDPVAVVATSGGALAERLPARGGARRRWSEAELAKVGAAELREAGAWLAVRVGALTEVDVRSMAKRHLWPPDVGTPRVADAVHRLTGGHAAGVELTMGVLHRNPKLLDDLDAVLRSPAPDAGRDLGQHLFDRVAAGLATHGRSDHLRRLLVTACAARDRDEAAALLAALRLPAEPALMTSANLWTHDGPRGAPALAPFTRLLGLRELAGEAGLPGWDDVFATLCDLAAGDEGGRLHHELALGGADAVAEVAAELADRLPGAEAERWLDMLDQVTATPDPRTPPETGVGWPLSGDERDAVTHLVRTLRALADPRLGDRNALHELHMLAMHDYQRIAGPSRAFQRRAQEHRRLADRLA